MNHRSAVLLLSGIPLLMQCSTVPLTGRRQFATVPTSQMAALGEDSYQQALQKSRLSGDLQSSRQVKEVGGRIARAVEDFLRKTGRDDRIQHLDWEFNLFEGDQKNAWALPGGKVAFYEGIIPVCQNENGIAVVMGHEVAHAIAGHSNERMSQALATQLGGLALDAALRDQPDQTQSLAMAAFGLGATVGLILPYSRLHEREADELGMIFMAMAGYNPEGAVGLWKRMAEMSKGPLPPTFLSTHPNPEERIQNARKHLPKAMDYYRGSEAYSR